MQGIRLFDPQTRQHNAASLLQPWIESVRITADWSPDVSLHEHVHLPLSDPLEGLVLNNWISTHVGGSMPVDARYDGSRWRRVEFRPNHINLRPSGISGAAIWRHRGTSLLLSISDRLVQSCAQEFGVTARNDTLLALANIDAPQIYATLLAMRAEAFGGCMTGPIYGESMARLLLAQIWSALGHRAATTALTANTGTAKPSVGRAIRYMRERLGHPLSLTEIAAVAAMSAFQFARAFKQRIGTPPHRYLLELRMQRARELLRGSNLAISAVATECGFDNQSHFARVFRRYNTIAPSAFREHSATDRSSAEDEQVTLN